MHRDTALHTGRSLAVSPFDFAQGKPVRIRRIFHFWNPRRSRALASLFASLAASREARCGNHKLQATNLQTISKSQTSNNKTRLEFRFCNLEFPHHTPCDAADGCYPLPCLPTLPAIGRQGGRVFGLSSPILPTAGGCKIECPP